MCCSSSSHAARAAAVSMAAASATAAAGCAGRAGGAARLPLPRIQATAFVCQTGATGRGVTVVFEVCGRVAGSAAVDVSAIVGRSI